MKFHGRWYAGRQLHCELSPVTRWKNAICGEFLRAASIVGLLLCNINDSTAPAWLSLVVSQDYLIDRSVPKENIATSCTSFETRQTNSGRPTETCTGRQTAASGGVGGTSARRDAWSARGGSVVAAGAQ